MSKKARNRKVEVIHVVDDRVWTGHGVSRYYVFKGYSYYVGHVFNIKQITYVVAPQGLVCVR